MFYLLICFVCNLLYCPGPPTLQMPRKPKSNAENTTIRKDGDDQQIKYTQKQKKNDTRDQYMIQNKTKIQKN